MVLIRVKQNGHKLPSAQLIMTSYFIFGLVHSFSPVIIKLIGVVGSNILYFDKVGL